MFAFEINPYLPFEELWFEIGLGAATFKKRLKTLNTW